MAVYNSSSSSVESAPAGSNAGEPLRIPSPSPTPGSTLSPAVALFYPPFYATSGGLTKLRRWVDDDGEESNDDHPTTFWMLSVGWRS